MSLAERAETAQQQRRFYATRLSAGTRLLLLLLRLRFSLDEEDFGLLSGHLTPLVDETPDQVWEIWGDMGMGRYSEVWGDVGQMTPLVDETPDQVRLRLRLA